MDPCNDSEDNPSMGGACLFTLFMDLFFGPADLGDIYARESERIAQDLAPR